MSARPLRASCSLCGAILPDNPDSRGWMEYYQTLYIENGHWKRAKLSEMYTRPFGSFETMNNVQSTLPDDQATLSSHEAGLWRTHRLSQSSSQDAVDSWGIPFHSACWDLLLTAGTAVSIPVDIQVLFELCISQPLGKWLDWGHDYGGIIPYTLSTDTSSQDEDTPQPGPGKGYPYIEFENPYRVENIAAFHKLMSSMSKRLFGGTASDVTTTRIDRFLSLPVEIRIRILYDNNLSLVDVANLRDASSAFTNIQLTNSFFENRFLPYGEFGHLFELLDLAGSLSWKECFQAAWSSRHLPSMKNRRRVWRLALELLQLIQMRSESWSCVGVPSRTFFEDDIPQDERSWASVGGNTDEYQLNFTKGCRALFLRSVAVPAATESLEVLTIRAFGKSYVRGLRFITDKGETTELGFVAELQSMDSAARCYRLAYSQGIKGFDVAYDDRGIRGVALVDGHVDDQQWAGTHDGLKKQRLLFIGPDTTLRGGFDALKMVSLSVPG